MSYQQYTDIGQYSAVALNPALLFVIWYQDHCLLFTHRGHIKLLLILTNLLLLLLHMVKQGMILIQKQSREMQPI